MHQEEHKQKILNFLQAIAIPVRKMDLAEDTFLPGIKIDKGCLLYDEEKMIYPGDLLHEAGHIALMTPDERKTIVGDVKAYRTPAQDDELGVMLWSFAASKHIGIPSSMVFHRGGYHGQADFLVQEFESGIYRGLPLLAWMGLCDPAQFPYMKSWIRTSTQE